MKTYLFKITIFLILGLVGLPGERCYAQQKPAQIINLKAVADSFQVIESTYTYSKKAITANDTSGFGTTYYSNVIAVKTDVDSVLIRYDPALKPYGQVTLVNIVTPHFRKVLRYTFYPMWNEFTPAYMDSVRGISGFLVPEVYELTNVVYALTKNSDENTTRTFKNSAYYRQVLHYFEKYKDHRLVRLLDSAVAASGSDAYYSFRENSFCYKFQKGRLVWDKVHYHVWGDWGSSLFQKYIPLLNDFVRKGNYRKFYKEHRSYYDSLCQRAQQLMPVDQMQKWLEANFSNKMDAYNVVFSPLILGSHSTQQYSWVSSINPIRTFKESVMFVSSTLPIEQNGRLTGAQKEGLATGVLFTEIDHNYCNPLTDQYGRLIDSALSNRGRWVSKDGDGELYPGARSIFNEYMTHAVYLLYCHDRFDPETFRFIKKNREQLMINTRKYIQFQAFDEMLLSLYQTRKPKTPVSSLYPQIISWVKVHN